MRRRCERDDRGGSRFTLRRVCRLSSSRRLRSNLRRTAFHDKKKERRARRENASSRPRHLTMHAKKYQNTESARELRGVRGFGCDADSRHALVHAHRAFFEDVSLGRRADGGGSRRETVYFCAAFSAHHRLRDRETARCVLTESRGIASRASPPREGASPRRAGGTRAIDRGVVRSVARVPLLDRDTRVRGSRSSSSARTRPFVARFEASVDHVVRPAPALELHAQGVRAPAGVPGDGERRRGRDVLGRQRGLEGARVFPSPPRPLARTARVRRKRKAERSTPEGASQSDESSQPLSRE